MKNLGYKYNKDLFNNLFIKLIPQHIDVYVEPFGGKFGLYKLIKDRINTSIYNDIDTTIYELNKGLSTISYNTDYKEIIERYNNTNTFFYLDPPYFGKEHYYKHTFKDEQDHIILFNNINNIKGSFLLSYNKCDFILNLYDKFDIYQYDGKSLYHQNEIVITNVKIYE